MATPSSSSYPSQSKSPIASNSGEFTVNINATPTETELPSTSCLQLETQLGKSKVNYNSTAVNPCWDAKNKVWRDSSYDFSNDAAIKAMGNLSEDFEIVAETPSIGQISASEVPVSFKEGVRRRSNARGQQRTSAGEEVVAYTTTSSFGRNSGLLSTKIKSRLLDTPQLHNDERSQSMAMQSGQLDKGCEVEEDDPFSEDDLPEDYKKLNFSTLTILQLVSLILLILALVCSVVIPVLGKILVAGLKLWKWALMVLLLICGRMVSGGGVRVVVFFMERNFLLRKRVLYFVYGLRNAVQNCIWLSLILIAWQCIFSTRVEKVIEGKILPLVTRILICLLVGTFIWLAKTVLVKVLAMSFHVNAFFDRIEESLFTQYVIRTLSGPPLIQILHEQEEEDKTMAEEEKVEEDKTMAEEEKVKEGRITLDHLHKLTQKNISAWNMKRLMSIIRKGVLSTLDEQLHECIGRDESVVKITSEKLAKVAAKKIFNNVAKPGSEFIYTEDLLCFMREDEASKVLRLFEGGNEAKGISKRALKDWVVNAFWERKALALSLNDTKTAVNKLHQMLNVLVAVLVAVISLLILEVATTHFFIFLISQILLVAFMFGNTAKTIFEGIIFLFIMHPYDVGDRVEIDGVQMVVEEMNLLTTVFLRYDNQKMTYPNSVLSTKLIGNFYRSPDMGDSIDFAIHISTPMEKIATMKERITSYIENKCDHWYPAPLVVMRDVEDMNRIKWSVWISHTMNFQDMGERWVRRAQLVEEMVKIFKELDIEYRMLPVDVHVRNMPSLTSICRLPSNWTACSR